MLNEILKIIKDKHDGELNLADDVYYLFLNDAVVMIYLDEEEKTIKVDVEIIPEDDTYVYFSHETSLNDLMEGKSII